MRSYDNYVNGSIVTGEYKLHEDHEGHILQNPFVLENFVLLITSEELTKHVLQMLKCTKISQHPYLAKQILPVP